jgi:KDEL-tailed cysteine endopeptidase
MIRALIFALLVLAVHASTLIPLLNERKYYEEKFYEWLKVHTHVQPENGEDFARLLGNFAMNDDFIANHNSRNVSFTLGHNGFSHMSYQEWREMMNFGLQNKPSEDKSAYLGMEMAPEDPEGWTVHHHSRDWVEKGAVTPVKNQGQCGSCWSFSTTGALEGAYQIKTGSLVSFSEQNLVDCDKKDHGCNGGMMDQAFTWVKENGGLCTESGYPYTSGETQKPNRVCKAKSCGEFVSDVAPKGYKDVDRSSHALCKALDKNPVSVAIEADSQSFMLYESGIYSDPCGPNLDHGVLAVGFGKDETGEHFFKVKNSWGPEWGENGYIRLARGKGYEVYGQCGILLMASYPVL